MTDNPAPSLWSGLHRYRFRSAWELSAPRERVYRVLADPRSYPVWWPEIREVRQLDDRSGVMRFRSVLPYELAVVAAEARQDPLHGVLEAWLDGDLEGVTRWTVTARSPGLTVAVFDEDVIVRKPLMRLLALPARPLFRANHALMMRSGRVGLAHYLSTHGIGLDQ
ncbi:SRPBCC family protein [Streptacidiphilus sp. P02-A3a]|uniref:SRPBCC family protein n=1 Tax=Streptacidiphilus sp. P02-A3a TaxID=2704468 RepID=UPI0015FE3D2C|nr:SRPBCC family protein [Streptacidiphilus sp. P02-A3a]QMU68957.1 polyketide cyclase [Streptacidiphilus sp. P02-A3a]